MINLLLSSHQNCLCYTSTESSNTTGSQHPTGEWTSQADHSSLDAGQTSQYGVLWWVFLRRLLVVSKTDVILKLLSITLHQRFPSCRLVLALMSLFCISINFIVIAWIALFISGVNGFYYFISFTFCYWNCLALACSEENKEIRSLQLVSALVDNSTEHRAINELTWYPLSIKSIRSPCDTLKRILLFLINLFPKTFLLTVSSSSMIGVQKPEGHVGRAEADFKLSWRNSIRDPEGRQGDIRRKMALNKKLNRKS